MVVVSRRHPPMCTEAGLLSAFLCFSVVCLLHKTDASVTYTVCMCAAAVSTVVFSDRENHPEWEMLDDMSSWQCQPWQAEPRDFPDSL